MTQLDSAFVGSVPTYYDQGLGPMFFEPYAQDLARRARVAGGASVLEVSAGTGIATRHLLKALPADARVTVTDLNPDMLAIAQPRIANDPRVQYRTADATALPFGESEFDLVFNQFGVMFPPDKVAIFREAKRVLRPSGRFLFNTWGSLADNPIGLLAHEVITSFFPEDPPHFYETPFGLSDAAVVERLAREGGFEDFEADVVDRTAVSATAEAAARGLVFGSPVFNQIQQRNGDPAAIMQALTERLTHEGGASPMRLPMRALVFDARRH